MVRLATTAALILSSHLHHMKWINIIPELSVFRVEVLVVCVCLLVVCDTSATSATDHSNSPTQQQSVPWRFFSK